MALAYNNIKEAFTVLILTSNGLSSEKLLNETKKYILSGMKKAAMITTASAGYKEKDWHVPKLTTELTSLGLSVDYFDFDVQKAELLESYDVIEIIGGNPFYLLKKMKESNCAPLFKKFKNKKVIIGISAGSIVLQNDIGLIAGYSPELNSKVGLTDFTGLCLTDIFILPHYHKFKTRFDNFEQRAQEYERKNNCKILRIDDGQGIFVCDAQTYMVV